MKKIIALLLALVMMLSLTACGAKETPAETTAAPVVEAPAETAAPETEAPTEAAEWPKTIVDVVGNEIALEDPATRLVGTHNPTMNMAVTWAAAVSISPASATRKWQMCCTPTTS